MIYNLGQIHVNLYKYFSWFLLLSACYFAALFFIFAVGEDVNFVEIYNGADGRPSGVGYCLILFNISLLIYLEEWSGYVYNLLTAVLFVGRHSRNVVPQCNVGNNLVTCERLSLWYFLPNQKRILKLHLVVCQFKNDLCTCTCPEPVLSLCIYW